MEELKQLPPAAFEDAGPPGSTASRRAWKPPPARWARASPTPSAWRWPRSCWRANSTGPGYDIVDHHTYVFLGDGCLMEGISHEACSLAGTLGLDKLIAFYDDNGISIDGQVEGWFTDDTPKRFEAYGWHVIAGVDGHDREAIDAAIVPRRKAARQADADLLQDRDRQGRAEQGRHATSRTARRSARSEVAATREALGWHYAPFEVPAEIYAAWDARASGASAEAEWDARSRPMPGASRPRRPSSSAAIQGELPADWSRTRPRCSRSPPRRQDRAGRHAQGSQHAIEGFAPCCRNCSAARPT